MQGVPVIIGTLPIYVYIVKQIIKSIAYTVLGNQHELELSFADTLCSVILALQQDPLLAALPARHPTPMFIVA